MPNIINVSNRLPITVGETIVKSSGGLVAALEAVTLESGELKWIGWPGEAIADADAQEKIRAQLDRDYHFTPVFLSDEEVAAYYEGFSNSSLWPLLHYMPSKFRYDPAWWDAYRSVNEKFCQAVLAVVKEGDIVWVHDYQLMLLPAMIRQKMPGVRIGFFLHTPFPSYEIFRFHPKRSELIEGLLGADQIGFHTFGYMRHFRSAALRLLGIESEMTRIHHKGHAATIGVYPIGIHAKKFESQLHTPEHGSHLEKIAEENHDRRLVLSVERMDYTKGILHRLDAIEMYLKGLQDRDHIKFLFVAVPSRETVQEYADLREEVEARIGRLNGKYATLHNSPIHFIHGSVEFADLCALYAYADVAMVTPVIDGMNLVAKEYIACQEQDPGVLILSEFAGAAEELFNALIVNPYDAQSVAGALTRALEMESPERDQRMQPMRQRVIEFDAQWWAKTFIAELSAISPQAEHQSSLEDARRQLAAAIADGRHVALFLDYDGTLRELERHPQAATPNAQVHDLLAKLAEAKVTTTLISGRKTSDLEDWFGAYPFGLVAEHGAFIRSPHSSKWQPVDEQANLRWKDDILKLLKQFAVQTPGTFVEEKRLSLVWHYRNADPDFGEHKARQLVAELVVLAANEPVVIRRGRKIVEIAASHISKGAAVKRMLEEQKYDLALCAGDDQTDESMFSLGLKHLLTMKVGTGDTMARLHVDSPDQFRQFIASIL